MVTEETIEVCINAGLRFLSGRATPPVNLHVITDQEQLKLYVDAYKAEYENITGEKIVPLLLFKNCEIDKFNEINSRIEGNVVKFCFDGCVIKNPALAISCEVKNSKVERITGNDVQITCSEVKTVQSSTKVKVSDSRIERLIPGTPYRVTINNSTVDQITFNGTFPRGLSITESALKEVEQFSAEFSSKNVNFRNVKFCDVYTDHALGIYRSMKAACEQAHYEHGVILFHGLELETYYNVHLKNCEKRDLPEKISSQLHRAFTDYGRDALRPFYWLFAFFVSAFFINYFEQLNAKTSLLIAFKNVRGPLMFALPKELREDLVPNYAFTQGFEFVHIILSSVLWFLIIFMIRRRFKI